MNVSANRRSTVLFYFVALAVVLCFSSPRAADANQTWNPNPTNGDWNTAANWTPAVVPGPGDIVTFNVSNVTAISNSADASAFGMVFNPGANGYTFVASSLHIMTLGAGGITNSSGITQHFVSMPDAAGNPGAINFTGTGAAGAQTDFIAVAQTTVGGDSGAIEFLDSASAGQGIFTNEGSALSGGSGGETLFFFTSTAGQGTFNNQTGQVSGSGGGGTIYYSSSQGGNAVLNSIGAGLEGAGPGFTLFTDKSSAGSSTLIAMGGSNGGDGGLIEFESNSAGGAARVEVFGNGHLDISPRSTGLTIGSLEGDGSVFLGHQNLSIGSNGLSTAFSGAIQDGGISGKTGGAVTKIGSTTLTLSAASTYTGGTTVSAGMLVVSNRSGSATGTGTVQVNGGTMGGSGIISGAVTVSGGAFLAPAHGSKAQSTLTIQNALTFNSGSTYTYTFKAKGKKAKTDKVIANGVTINSGANVTIQGTTKGSLKAGTAYTLISNTSANPISGTFSNLADGAIVNVNGNNLQVSYEGSDGNDLTLTVVP